MQLRKIDIGRLLATLVTALAIMLLLVTPARTQETTLAEESVEAEQTSLEEDTSQSEQSGSRSATQVTAEQETTTPPDAEATAQQTTTPPTADSTTRSSAQQQDGCRVVDTFSGSGETRTDTPFFRIVGPQWRVAYQAENIAPPPVGMLFAFFIRNERGQPLDPNGVAIRSEQSGIKNVNSDPGQYYIQIISSQVDWALRVEDCGNPDEDPNDNVIEPIEVEDNDPVRAIEDRREEVMKDSIAKRRLSETGGPALFAPAVVLLLSGATVVVSVIRKQ